MWTKTLTTLLWSSFLIEHYNFSAQPPLAICFSEYTRCDYYEHEIMYVCYHWSDLWMWAWADHKYGLVAQSVPIQFMITLPICSPYCSADLLTLITWLSCAGGYNRCPSSPLSMGSFHVGCIRTVLKSICIPQWRWEVCWLRSALEICGGTTSKSAMEKFHVL